MLEGHIWPPISKSLFLTTHFIFLPIEILLFSQLNRGIHLAITADPTRKLRRRGTHGNPSGARAHILHATIPSAQLASELMASGAGRRHRRSRRSSFAPCSPAKKCGTPNRTAAIFAGSWKTKSSKISMPCSSCSFIAFPCCAKHQTPCPRTWSRLCAAPSRWAWRKSRASTWPWPIPTSSSRTSPTPASAASCWAMRQHRSARSGKTGALDGTRRHLRPACRVQ